MLACMAFTGCKNDDEDDLLQQVAPPETEKTDKAGYDGLALNEICGKQDPDDDWVELYNSSAKDIDLAGCKLVKTDEEGQQKVIYTAPKGKTVKTGAFVVIATLSGELQGGISNSKEVGIDLQSPDGKSLSKFDRDSDVGKDNGHKAGGSYARIPDGTGKWQVVAKATRGGKNS